MTEAVARVLEHIRGSWDPACRHILMMHLSAAGAELSESDRSAANSSTEDGHWVGGSSSVRPDLFEGFDYVALGHIHKPQQLGGHVYYSGSPVPYSFGREEKQTKGVWLYDTVTGETAFRELQQLHPRVSLSCTYQEAAARTDLQDTYLCLTLTDRMASTELTGEMSWRFPLLMELRGVRARAEVTGLLAGADVRSMSDKDILAHYLKDVFGMDTLDDDLAELFIQTLENAKTKEVM